MPSCIEVWEEALIVEEDRDVEVVGLVRASNVRIGDMSTVDRLSVSAALVLKLYSAHRAKS